MYIIIYIPVVSTIITWIVLHWAKQLLVTLILCMQLYIASMTVLSQNIVTEIKGIIFGSLKTYQPTQQLSVRNKLNNKVHTIILDG